MLRISAAVIMIFSSFFPFEHFPELILDPGNGLLLGSNFFAKAGLPLVQQLNDDFLTRL